MMANTLAHDLIKPVSLCWLTAGIVLAILPHGLRMTLWILPLTLALILWRLGSEFRGWPLPGRQHQLLRIVQILLMVGAGIGVYISFHTLAGREAGSALLVLLAGFKLLEAGHERDFYITTFLGFFIIITNFFVSETISTAAYMLFTLLVMFSALIIFNDRHTTLPTSIKIKLAGNILLQALPVMLVAFILFPRVNGPLWGLPQDAHSGMMGISDEMEPGSISNLIQSNEVAFRVEFNGTPPANKHLYWRGPVLWYNDGRRWSRERVIDSTPAEMATSGEPVKYSVTLEPTNQRWLFALEMTDQAPPDTYLSNDHQLRVREPVRKRIRYELASYPNYRLGRTNTLELERTLQLPPGAHTKTVALARSWVKADSNPDEIIQRALRMFNQDDFYYTLTPPLLTGDPVDEFLFTSRQGFCEHYASAFTVLMRAAGIPARIVAGYQGGRFNPVGDYFIVYQRDAHAWVEVWLGNRGWVRVDPTSAVSPMRVEQGITEALPDTVLDMPAVFGQMRFSRDLWQNMRNMWDAVNNQWIQWVITYGPERQTQLLKKFGIDNLNLQLLGSILIIIVALMFLVLSAWLLKRYRPSRDPARHLYDRFCLKLAKIGIRRLPHEGPVDFARRATTGNNILAPSVNEITTLYVAVRYGSQPEKLQSLKQHINRFQPGKLLRTQ